MTTCSPRPSCQYVQSTKPVHNVGVWTCLVSVRAEWDAKCACESKIGEFEVESGRDEQILWLQVTMQNPMCVAVQNAQVELIREFL